MKCASCWATWVIVCLLALVMPAQGQTPAVGGGDGTTSTVGEDLPIVPGLQAAPPHDILYAKIGQTLVKVDHVDAPGLSEVIGPIGFGSIYGMDFDPEGTFFAVGNAPGLPGKYLIVIDPVMGTGTRIGGPLTGIGASFACDPQGNLYGADTGQDTLYRIDRVTGLSSPIGHFGYNTDHQSMDFSPDGILYLLTRRINPGSPPYILRVDHHTGHATPVAQLRVDFGWGPEPLEGRTDSYGVSFASDGTLYASFGIDGRPWLLRVDIPSGICTALGIMELASGQRVETSSIAFGPRAWSNVPPVPVIKGPNQVEATSANGAQVTLDGSDSYDPDSTDPLLYAWVDEDWAVLGILKTLTLTLPLGPNPVSLVVWDSGGKGAQEWVTVQIVDTTPPTIVGPDSITLEGESPQGVAVTHPTIQAFLGGASATDIVDPSPVITNDAPAGYFALKATVVTFTASDASGNASMALATVNVVDTTPPNLTPPGPVTVEGQDPQGIPVSAASIQAFLAAAAATDICDPSPVITNDITAAFLPLGTTVVTFTARDAWGNETTGQASVTVVDTTPPALTPPGAITLEGQSPDGVPATDAAIQAFLAAATATDAVDPAPVVTNDAPAGFFPLGTTVVTFVASDASGNESTVQSSVTVQDTTPPNLSAPAAITVEAQGPYGVPATDAAIQAFLAAATATDVVDPAPVLTNDAPADFFPLGTAVVTFVARDASGNESTVQSSVTVMDGAPPEITVPAPITLEAQGPQGVPASDPAIQAFLAAATATDAVDPAPVLIHDAPGDFFPLGTTVVTFTAHDATGHTATAQSSVTVLDTTPPSLSVPAPITLDAQGPGGVPASDPAIQAFLAAATATDTVDPAPVVTNDAPGDTFPLGTTVVTFTATDASGNTAIGQSSVTVVDTTPPSLTVPAPITIEAQGPGGVPSTDPAIQAFLAAATATDAIDPSPVITNDAPAGLFPMGMTVVTFTATDASGNTATGQSSVTVVDTTPPTIAGPDPITLCTHGPSGVPVSYAEIQAFLAGATATDLCDPSPVITSDCPSDYLPMGVTVVTFTATDASGNSVSCQSTVTVVNFAPVVGPIHAPDTPQPVNTPINVWSPFTDQAVLLTHTAVWEWGDGSQSAGVVMEEDGAGTVTGTHVYSAQGVYTIRLTVTDNCGLSGAAEYQYVVVYDPAGGGFVTGGVWIDSPEGAVSNDPLIADKANFGFVAKYLEGETVPTGQVEFNFQEADLNFHSTNLEWLVVEGPIARLRGKGTITGAGEYDFLLTVIDGDLSGNDPFERDGFRIKISDANESVIYDNQMGERDYSDATTELGGGNIVIHAQ